MDSHGLERASEYLNNLLLARGLLSNAKPIDFARPDRHGSGTDVAMSRVINLVHDLVLQRDRDADQREIMAENIRKARAGESQRTLDLQKVQDKNAELTREAASAQAKERALKISIRKAEAQAKDLKEQALKMKSTLDQVRAKCLSDVRKRDVELDKLKAHLAGLQRGKKEASGMKINVINWDSETKGKEMRNGQVVSDVEGGVDKETNDFLAALLDETSTENVSLRRIATDTMDILRELTGLDEAAVSGEGDEEEDGIGIPGQYRKSRRKATEQPRDQPSCDALAQQMSAVLEHCQTILKDPSFVPIEEVQLRDEEIIKLRVGWERMALRWKEAVTMMDNWRRRIIASGEGLPSNDLSNLDFGKSIAMLPNGQPVFGADEEMSYVLYENGSLEEQAEEDMAHDGHRAESRKGANHAKERQESDLEIPPEPSPKRRASVSRRNRLNIGKPVRPLQVIDPNLGGPQTRARSSISTSWKDAESGIGSTAIHLGAENEPKSQPQAEQQVMDRRMRCAHGANTEIDITARTRRTWEDSGRKARRR